jgi:hypothetical protein
MGLRDFVERAFTGDDWPRADEEFRERHTAFGTPELEYERVLPAYQFGHVAAHDERFAGSSFEDVEDVLRAEWSPDLAMQCGSWDVVRGYVNRAYQRVAEHDAYRGVLPVSDDEIPVTPEILDASVRADEQ